MKNKILEMFKNASWAVKEKKEEEEEKRKLASKEEVNEFISNINNKRLEDLETNTNLIIHTLNELIKVEKDTQEYLVQLATSIQEIEHILDTKIIMMSQHDSDMSSLGSDTISMIVRKPGKKMMN